VVVGEEEQERKYAHTHAKTHTHMPHTHTRPHTHTYSVYTRIPIDRAWRQARVLAPRIWYPGHEIASNLRQSGISEYETTNS